MAKRDADDQLNQNNAGSSDDNGSWRVTSTPQKNTAARLVMRRIAQPRGARRPAVSGVRRPAPSSPAVSNQQQPPAFGQTNGTQQTESRGGFTFGQSQLPSASASFPPFGNSNNSGNSSNITPPSSSFSFGSQLASNPFTASATFGGNDNNKSDQSTAQAHYSPSNNLFLQPSEIIQADAASAGLSPSVAAPHLEPGPVDHNISVAETPKKRILHLNPPKDNMGIKRRAVDELDFEGYPKKPSGPGRPGGPTASQLADRAAMPPPPVPVKGQPMVFHNSAPPSKPGTYGSAGRTTTVSPLARSEQPQPFVFHNTAPPSKPGTYGSAARTIPSPTAPTTLLIPQDPVADEMDTEATSAVTVPSAPAPQNIFGGVGACSPSTPNIFGNSSNPQVPQGNPNFLASVSPGSAPSHDPDEMSIDLPENSGSQNNELWRPLEDFKAWQDVLYEVFDGTQYADMMDTEHIAAPEPSRNSFQSQGPPENKLNMFATTGKSSESTNPFGQQMSSMNSQQASLPTFNWGHQATPASAQPQQTSMPAFNWGQQTTPASTQPQQTSLPAFNWGQQSTPSSQALLNPTPPVNWGQQTTPASSQPQQNPVPTFNWGQQTTPASLQPQQTPVPMFNWDQQTTPASSQLQSNPTPAINWGQQTASALTQSQQNSTPAFAFSQSMIATQGQEASHSDAMMVSPEKNTPGRSLFDRIERAPADTTLLPATTSTTSPLTSLFNQNASSHSGLSENRPSVVSTPITNASERQGDLLGEATAPAHALLGQNTNNEVAQSSDLPRPSSPTKKARQMAEPSKHVEDKPTEGSPFGGILPEDKSSASVPSSFATKPQLEAASTSGVRSSGGLFGSFTNDNAGTSNLLKPSNLNQAATLAPSKPLNEETTSKDVRSPLQTSSTAQNVGRQNLGAASKLANTINPAANADERLKITGLKRGLPREPPENWTTGEKKQYTTAYRLKQLDVGAEAKRKALISARHTRRIKHLKEFYRLAEKNIKAADGGPVRPVSPSLHGSDSEQNEIDSVWPPVSRVLRKRAGDSERSDRETSSKRLHDDQKNHYFESAAPVPAAKRKADGQADRERGPGPNESGKRARVAEGDQVSYPSLKPAETNSSTSSMFKGILDKPAALTNGEPSAESSSAPSKLAESDSSSLVQSSSNLEDSTTEVAKPSSSPFVFKPMTANSEALSASDNAVVKPPTFGGSGGPTNFLAQFGAISAVGSKEEMEKRKAEDMDSDEDEAEWERRDAEKQRAKKQVMDQEASKLKPKYMPGKGFVFETASNENESKNPEAAAAAAAGATSEVPVSVLHVNELDKQHAEYAKQQAAAASFANPFAKFIKQDSGNEGSKNGDADDEEERSDEEEQAPKKPIGGSLFDRISAPSSKENDSANKDHPLKASSQGINMFGHLSSAAVSVPGFNEVNQTASPAKSTLFGKLSSSTPSQNVFGTPPSTRPPIAPGSGEKGDNTWNPESPIKFTGSPDAGSKKRARENDDSEENQGSAKRTDVKDAPAVNVTSPSPSMAPLGSLFGVAKPNATIETPSKTSFNPTPFTPTGSVASSFGFGISPIKPTPALTSLFPPSTNITNGMSRSTSPGATTGESATESNADGEDDGVEKHEQLNLTGSGPGEEDEDVLYEVRAKVNVWDDNKENENGEKKGGWETKGLGQFRIMKNRKTGKARMLMRSDPAGRIIINSSISKQFKYDAPTKSVCRIPVLSPSQKIETLVIKVGKDADTTDIARILEENKDQN